MFSMKSLLGRLGLVPRSFAPPSSAPAASAAGGAMVPTATMAPEAFADALADALPDAVAALPSPSATSGASSSRSAAMPSATSAAAVASAVIGAAMSSAIPAAIPTILPEAIPAPLPGHAPAEAAPGLAGPLGRGVKRAFDVSAALTLLVMLSPLLGVVAVLVKRDGGPCLFGHPRVGLQGRAFRCLKFRSMVPNADAVLQALLASDPQARAEWDRDFKLRNDVRVTRLGRFLRKSSIDELPQLWNVVRGDMSLVGPRPIVGKELERYGDHAADYLRVLPGITGLWQVSGRNDADYVTRVALDVAYIRSWSFQGDLVILFKTIGVVFRGRGAY